MTVIIVHVHFFRITYYLIKIPFAAEFYFAFSKNIDFAK